MLVNIDTLKPGDRFKIPGCDIVFTLDSFQYWTYNISAQVMFDEPVEPYEKSATAKE